MSSFYIQYSNEYLLSSAIMFLLLHFVILQVHENRQGCEWLCGSAPESEK